MIPFALRVASRYRYIICVVNIKSNPVNSARYQLPRAPNNKTIDNLCLPQNKVLEAGGRLLMRTHRSSCVGAFSLQVTSQTRLQNWAQLHWGRELRKNGGDGVFSPIVKCNSRSIHCKNSIFG